MINTLIDVQCILPQSIPFVGYLVQALRIGCYNNKIEIIHQQDKTNPVG